VLVVELVGDAVGVALVDDRELGVAAVVVPSGERRRGAEVLGCLRDRSDTATGAPKPGDADPAPTLNSVTSGPSLSTRPTTS